ncbi:cupredoxin domain-containing protein [Ottowia testudinis]|uniref:Cupredoxin family protein n=1 Tax=Ottowia testudinis TaxID=2816950 RepID=A0A975CEG1_9BURK|nr:cupredoxin family protein [Ottowia testudinis]QTD44948.1 cupredoxin family protein [Ottowia testudinis]
MKKIITILALVTVPFAAFASGDHAGGHAMNHATPDSAAGKPAATGTKVARTINVTMSDAMRFSPDSVEVKAGETVRFFVKNEGKITHEFVIGNDSEIKEHAEMMKQMPGMTHNDGSMITLKPGQKGAVTWTFSKSGNFSFGCTVPGHLEAGMVGKFSVTP